MSGTLLAGNPQVRSHLEAQTTLCLKKPEYVGHGLVIGLNDRNEITIVSFLAEHYDRPHNIWLDKVMAEGYSEEVQSIAVSSGTQKDPLYTTITHKELGPKGWLFGVGNGDHIDSLVAGLSHWDQLDPLLWKLEHKHNGERIPRIAGFVYKEIGKDLQIKLVSAKSVDFAEDKSLVTMTIGEFERPGLGLCLTTHNGKDKISRRGVMQVGLYGCAEEIGKLCWDSLYDRHRIGVAVYTINQTTFEANCYLIANTKF